MPSGQKTGGKNADEVFFEHIRVTTVQKPFDTVTLSQQLLSDTDTLVDLMNAIAKGSLFVYPLNNKEDNPGWFNLNSSNTVAGFVVARFEVQLRYL